MAETIRRIGLSLGADICWPACYEALLARLNPTVRWRGERIRFEVERVTIEPFDLRQPCRYDVVVDRLTHWYHTSREWIKKAVVLDDLYVFNNPWSVQANEKHTSYCAMMRLGLNIPGTWMIPPKSYEKSADLQPTLTRYARLFDLAAVGRSLGYPLFMKPYDGGGWVGVTKVDDEAALRTAYDASGTKLMHLQQGVIPYQRFVRCIGFGPQTRAVNYDPSAPLHDRYTRERDFLSETERAELEDITLTVNAFFGWDFNSCEALLKDHTWYPIDFANACPDSQVTSLHYHFPWLVIANLRWSLYCAASKRRVRRNLDWEPYFEVAKAGMPYRERLAKYAALARRHFEADAFGDFCASELKDLDAVAWEFFGTDRARAAVRAKVEALYPAHEVESFTALFWSRIQDWRNSPEARRA